MFRIRARIDPVLLRRHAEQVKAGLPGVAWVRLDPQASWPDRLAVSPRFELGEAASGLAAEASP